MKLSDICKKYFALTDNIFDETNDEPVYDLSAGYDADSGTHSQKASNIGDKLKYSHPLCRLVL